MLSHSDIDLESIGEKPTAVFIVIQDEKKTYHSLVTILLKQIYETLISVAQRHGGKLPVRTNFLLDEFANMPPLKDVTTMITAARSRQIRFTMIIQNFAQLDDVYGKEEAETIRGNCGNIIYLITTELKALEEISKMCGEVKSKKDDKTASTPLVTVSDLQRMKQFEVIILRMRKQPFKTKFTPYFKLDWGKKYPPAKYPSRPKEEVHVFDIKEFVKNQKKKKLLDMMNAADDKDKENASMGMLGGANPFADSLPPELRAARQNNSAPTGGIPDFLTRPNVPKKEEKPLSSGIPDFETFKKQMESGGSFNPFETKMESPVKKPAPVPKPEPEDDDLGFDVDELVKKIDAKIAELEAEEKRAKDEEKKENVTPATTTTTTTTTKTTTVTAPVPAEVPDFSSKTSNSINDIYKETKEVSKPVTVTTTTTQSTNLSLDDDSDSDDDFFDDFFDN